MPRLTYTRSSGEGGSARWTQASTPVGPRWGGAEQTPCRRRGRYLRAWQVGREFGLIGYGFYETIRFRSRARVRFARPWRSDGVRRSLNLGPQAARPAIKCLKTTTRMTTNNPANQLWFQNSLVTIRLSTSDGQDGI